MLKVNNIKGSHGSVKNQFEITTDKGTAFQSYDSVIAFRDIKGNISLDDKYWDYSKTTGRYRNLFLNESKAETVKKINNGTYKLVNLN